MHQPIRSHLLVLFVFCGRTLLQPSLFSSGIVYGQTEDTVVNETVTDSNVLSDAPDSQNLQDTENEKPVINDQPAPELITIYETETEPKSENISVKEENQPSEENNKATQTPPETGIALLPETQTGALTTTGSLLEIIEQEEELDENQVGIDEEPGTKKELLQTIYEKNEAYSGDTMTSYTETITVLTNKQLTVIIPEDTRIRTAQGKNIEIPQLELNLSLDRSVLERPSLDKSDEQITTSGKNEFVNNSKVASSITQQLGENDTLYEYDTPDEINIASGINNIQEQLIEEDSSSLPTQEEDINTEKDILEEVFEFGLPGEHLLFSQPVEISYQVPFAEGSFVEIQVQHAGDTQPGVEGLAIDNASSCLPDGSTTKEGYLTIVKGGKVTFFTCGASIFTVTYTGGPSAPNFVDNSSTDFTVLVQTGVAFPTGSTLGDVDILIDFRPIDNESPTGPWGITGCFPEEKSFLLIHPDGTQVQLANAGTYTTPAADCPQAQILYDQSAASGIIGGVWNLTGDARQPVGNLNTLGGKSPFGTRTLRMADNVAQDGVILFGFDLTLRNVECGDGIISAGETCDDSNTNNGDGCNLSCQIEAGWECTGEPSVCTPISGPSGLRLHYDGSFAGGNFTDISGNGFNGTQFNGVTTGSVNGETIMCFNGTNQYIERATNLATAYPFTMSTWVRSDTVTGLHGIMSLARSTAGNRMYNIEHNGTTIRARAQNTAARYANATPLLNTTERFLLTAIFAANNRRDIYVNGEFAGSNTQNVTYDTNATKRLNIGRLADSSPSDYFDGCVDDIRFYASELTSGQVYTLYAQPAALTTSLVTVGSPQLTGTMQGILDTITLTITGTTYTGTNNGNGTWTLPAGIINPDLPSGTYPTVLTVTNPYGRAVTYNSSFIVNIPPAPIGDYCIASPSSLDFPQFTTEGYAQTGFASSSGYFELIDTSGADSGYYTTLEVTDLSGTFTTIPNSDLARQSSGITLLSGTANAGVVLGSAFSSYSVATGTVTFIKRDPAANSGITGIYGAILDLRISLPAYIRPDTYAGTMTYTLYEN